jgi:GMP synthase (glutamine-hydrolysing)
MEAHRRKRSNSNDCLNGSNRVEAKRGKSIVTVRGRVGKSLDAIAVLDFGGQYTQLIARRIRELGVFSEVLPHDVAPERLDGYVGVILSGGPMSVNDEGALMCDRAVFELKVPVLCICYGMQLLNLMLGGTVRRVKLGEYGAARIVLERPGQLFEGVTDPTVWMSHGDSLETIAPGLEVLARSADGLPAAVRHTERPIWGVQFHPEVSHTRQGLRILENFVNLTGASREWDASHQIERMVEYVRRTVGSSPVVSLVSGGVDSTVASAILARALPAEQVRLVHIDNGLMRKNESAAVVSALRAVGIGHIEILDASGTFLDALRGVTDPEQKRHIIGDTFVHVLDDTLSALESELGRPFLCQGTLYTDLIESGKGVGKVAAVIKTHHNVSSPRIAEWRAQGRIVEPNREIFKDEVRAVGRALGLPEDLIGRHPFPGPGLGIRILGEVTPERLETLREVDDIYIQELRAAGMYDRVWQAFAVLLPVQTVGVMGDGRTYRHAVALRAVDSRDGMTADWSQLPYELLGRVASRIVNEVRAVNRVVYDITSKPPATIEWE